MALNEDSDWLINADGVESIQAVVCDLNGILRGKRVPVTVAATPFVPHRYVRKGG